MGFAPEEATQLKNHSELLIQTKLALVQNIREWIEVNHLKQEEAAAIFGASRPRVSDLVNEKISKFTIDTLLKMLSKTGKTIHWQIS